MYFIEAWKLGSEDTKEMEVDVFITFWSEFYSLFLVIDSNRGNFRNYLSTAISK
jgi:hypothetical protein